MLSQDVALASTRTAARPSPAGNTLVNAWCDALRDVMMIFDRGHRLQYLNRAGERLVGNQTSEVLGQTVTELIAAGVGFFGDNPERASVLHRVLPHALAGSTLNDDETTVALSDGATGTYSWQLDPVWDGDEVAGAVLVMRDVSERTNATFQIAPVGMVRVRGDGDVMEVNPAFRTMLGLPVHSNALRPLRDFIHPEDRAAHDTLFAELIAGGAHRYQAERRLLHTDGSIAWGQVTIIVSARRALAGERWFDRAVAVIQDITERKRMESELRSTNAELAKTAGTDPSTGLHTRPQIEQRLEEVSSLSRRHGGGLAVVLLDIDHFAHITEGYGAHAGDAVLRAVAKSVQSSKRTEDICARWSYTELLILLPNTNLDGATAFADRIRREVAGTLVAVAGDTSIPINVSVGVATSDGSDTKGLLGHVEQSLHDAKAARDEHS